MSDTGEEIAFNVETELTFVEEDTGSIYIDQWGNNFYTGIDGTMILLFKGPYEAPNMEEFETPSLAVTSIVSFETDEDIVHSVHGLAGGASLAAIGNKLYLLYYGNSISDVTEVEITETDTTTTTEIVEEVPKDVTVVFPSGGESVEIGEEIVIKWTSPKGVNDAVSIELLKGGDESLVINSKTPNDGTFDWQVPLDTIPDADYQVKITWLSSNEEDPNNSDTGDNFAIIQTPDTSSNTGPTQDTANVFGLISSGAVRNAYGIPILDLPCDEHITEIMEDSIGGFLFTTSKGRILHSDGVDVNAYLTGNRKLTAKAIDGFGRESDDFQTELIYSLHDQIVEVNEDKEVEKFHFTEGTYAQKIDEIKATFVSPVIFVKNDFGIWKSIVWTENKDENTDILVCVRNGRTPTELANSDWDHCFISRDSDNNYVQTGSITRDLSKYDFKGQYMQIKVVMTSQEQDITPYMSNISLIYTTSFASYFFTVRFSLDKGTELDNVLCVADITKPTNTEVKIGVSDKDSADWDDYSIISLDELNKIELQDGIKVGMRLISYEDSVPEVANFALMTGGNKQQTISD